MVAVIAGGIMLFGSVDATIARLRNEPLSVYPSVVDFGVGKPGELLETTLEIGNWTDRPVRLIGGTVDCTCLT